MEATRGTNYSLKKLQFKKFDIEFFFFWLF